MLPGLVAVFALVLMALFPVSLPPVWRFQPTISAYQGFNFSAPVIVRLALGLARPAPAVVANASQPSFDEPIGCHGDTNSFGPVVLDPLGPVQHVRNDSQVLPPPAEQFHALVVPSSAPTDLAIFRSDLVVGSTDLVLTSTDPVVVRNAIAFSRTGLAQFSQSSEHPGVVHAMRCWQTGMARMAFRIKSRLLDTLVIARDAINESSSSLSMHGVATLLLLTIVIIQLVVLVGLARKAKRLELEACRMDASSDRPADHPAPAVIAIPIQWIDGPISIVVTWSNTVKTVNHTPTPDTKLLLLAASIPLPEDPKTDEIDLVLLAASIPLPDDVMADDTDLLLLAASIPLPEDTKTDNAELLLLAASTPLPEDVLTAEIDLVLLAASIPLPEDPKTDETELLLLAASIPLPDDTMADDILTDDKPFAVDHTTTAILVSSPAANDHLAPAPQDAAVSAAQDLITHSQSAVERVKSAEMAAVARACRFPNNTIAADTELLLLAASIPLPEDIPTSDDELLYLAASIPLPEDIPTANFGVALASAAVPILEMIPAIAFAAPRSDAINCEDIPNYPPPSAVNSPEPITEKRKIAKPRASTTKKAQWQAQTTVPVSGFNFAVALAAVPILETIPAVAFATPKSRSNEEQRVIYEDEALRPPPPVIDSMVAVAARPTLKPKISKVKKAKPSVPTSDFTFVFAVNSKG